jgi:hypothetical protein
MPGHPQAWIRSDRGIRRLQHEELAKAKGVPSSWLKGEGVRPLRKAQVDRATCIHLWSAAMDVMRPWILKEERPEIWESLSNKKIAVPKWRDRELPEEEWQWESPDLREGGEWFLAQVASLKKAIKEAPNPEELYEEGLQTLSIHQRNYSNEGPKQLQLLWWEFPKEHHKGLQQGFKMNFLITPGGELQLNSVMDDVERAAAGKFVDELELLGVLDTGGKGSCRSIRETLVKLELWTL